MKALLYADNTLPLAVPAVCDLVNKVCHSLKLTAGSTSVRVSTPTIQAGSTYRQLSRAVDPEARGYDHVFICAAVPYENNFFFDSDGNKIVLSFSGWNLLTDLPVSNGPLYFIASILCDLRGVDAHSENTGCVNDFWWDKRGVDVGMRAAFICAECRRRFPGDRALLADVERLLDLVSAASRAGRDVLTIGNANARGSDAGFDAFLCHNSEDKPAVRKINAALTQAGVRTWFDEVQLQSGRPWQPELERQIVEVRAACVFVGPNGRELWQDMEIRAFLSEFVNRGCPVIPVLLEDAGATPALPLFLKQMMWVDLRKDYRQNLSRLVATLLPRPAP